MSTAEAEELTLSPAAIEAIKQHVEAGSAYSDQLADAGVLAVQYGVVKNLHDSRYESDRKKREVLPGLLEEAARLEEESRRLAEAAAPLDPAFVRQLHLVLAALGHRGSQAAVDLLVAHSRLWPDPLAIATEKAKAARRLADDTARQCDDLLIQTSNVPPDPEAQVLSARLATLEAQAEKARVDISDAKRLPSQRQIVRDIAAGVTRPDMSWHLRHAGNPVEAERVFLSEARAKLAELAAIDVPAAEATIARCDKEAADARKRLADLAAQRRAKQLDPQNMSWEPSA